MTLDLILHFALTSAAVFLPIVLVGAGLGFLATRHAVSEGSPRRKRGFVVGASALVAAAATAYFWADTATALFYRRLLVTLAAPLATYLIFLLIDQWLSRHVPDDPTRLKMRKGFIYAGVAIVTVSLVNVWLFREQVNYTTVLSVMGAGLALALHQVLLCVTGWVMLHAERHYDVGDRVQIGDVKGDVSDIGILHTTLVEIGNWIAADQSTGRLVAVPNSHVFTQPIYNYTRGFEFIWNEVSVLITFESNWRKAEELMLALAQDGVEQLQERFRSQIRRMARKHMILYQHVTPIVYPRVLDSGVQLTLRYLTEPKRRRGTEADLTRRILDAFAGEPDIDFAYPTTRFYDATQEGRRRQPERPDAAPPDSPPPPTEDVLP